MKPKLYLSGQMDGISYEEMNDWREYIKFKHGPEYCISPVRRNLSVNDYVNIVRLDKADIGLSDCVLVKYKVPSAGTVMEILYAFELGKLVVVSCDTHKVFETLSPWITYHSHYQVIGLDVALETIGRYFNDFA